MDLNNLNALDDEALSEVNGGFGLRLVKVENLTDEQLLEEYRKAVQMGNKFRLSKLGEQIRVRGLGTLLELEKLEKAGKSTLTHRLI